MKEDDNMFVDEVLMRVEAGSGGNGCMAYRREIARASCRERV